MSSVDDYHTVLLARKQKLEKDADFDMVKLIKSGFKTTGIAIGVWMWGYLGMSVAWVFMVLFFHIISKEVGRQIISKRKFVLQSMNCEKGAILSRVDEKQSWIFFPDLEKAEWLNKMIKQMWPLIGDYADSLIMTTIQESIQMNMPSNLSNFKFTHVDMGDIPVRIEGVNVYIDANKREEVIMDLTIKYEGDASIKCEVKGISFGIKALQLRGNMRIVMNPLISEIPIVGGLSAFFLNTPEINFDMLAAASILDTPLIKNTIRDIVSKLVSDIMVLPRRIPISLNSKVDITKIRYPPSAGLVVVHVIEAKGLRAADVGVLKKPSSDPYCTVTIGNQVMKTKVIAGKLNPTWDEYFQAVVDQKHGQSVEIKVFDKDQGSSSDDALGNASLDIEFIAKKNQVDVWLPLANVQTGSLHVRALWMQASTAMQEFKPSAQVLNSRFAKAILLVVVESATNIPFSPNTNKARNPYVILRLRDDAKMTSVKNASKDPVWQENFNYFLSDPQNQQIDLKLMHKGSTKEVQMAHIVVPVNAVLLNPDLSMVKTYNLPEVSGDCTLTVRFVLRVLQSKRKVDEWSEYSSVASMGYGALMQGTRDGPQSTGTRGGGLLNIDFSGLSTEQEEEGGEAVGGDTASGGGGGASEGSDDIVGGGGGGLGGDRGLDGDEDLCGGGYGEEAGAGAPSSATGIEGAFGGDRGLGDGGVEGDDLKATPEAEALAAAGASSSVASLPAPSVTDRQTTASVSPVTSTAMASSQAASLSASFTDTGSDLHKTPSMTSSFASSLSSHLGARDNHLGQLQVTIRYSSSRSTLVLVVHQCRNLIPCDKDNLADPYVKVYLLPDRSSDSKRKTKVVKNSLNPVFDQTFEWTLGNMELPFRSIELEVKNQSSVFSRGRVQMGTLLIKLSQLDNPSQAFTQWFDLQNP